MDSWEPLGATGSFINRGNLHCNVGLQAESNTEETLKHSPPLTLALQLSHPPKQLNSPILLSPDCSSCLFSLRSVFLLLLPCDSFFSLSPISFQSSPLKSHFTLLTFSSSFHLFCLTLSISLSHFFSFPSAQIVAWSGLLMCPSATRPS